MEINQQEEQIIKGVLKYFIYHLRISDVCNKVFTYYTSDFSQRLNRIKIYHDFESVELQIKRKILTANSVPYWNGLKTSDIKVIEDFASKNGLSYFKDYINSLFKYKLEDFKKEQEEETKQKQNIEDEFLSKILYPKSNLLLIPVKNILKDNIEYKYKSDKVKAFLDIALNSDQIFAILSHYEDFTVTRSYIEKFRIERQSLITENKLKTYPQEESVKKYLR